MALKKFEASVVAKAIDFVVPTVLFGVTGALMGIASTEAVDVAIDLFNGEERDSDFFDPVQTGVGGASATLGWVLLSLWYGAQKRQRLQNRV